MSVYTDLLDWAISKIPALEAALKSKPDEKLNDPLGQLESEKAAQEIADERRERQNGVHR